MIVKTFFLTKAFYRIGAQAFLKNKAFAIMGKSQVRHVLIEDD